MIIEYTDTTRSRELIGRDFKAYFYFRKHNTQIIYDLWKVLENNIHENWDNLYELLRKSYLERTCRSRCEIYTPTESQIEINNKGIFPNILIIKE